jgi:hypothetical protein
MEATSEDLVRSNDLEWNRVTRRVGYFCVSSSVFFLIIFVLVDFLNILACLVLQVLEQQQAWEKLKQEVRCTTPCYIYYLVLFSAFFFCLFLCGGRCIEGISTELRVVRALRMNETFCKRAPYVFMCSSSSTWVCSCVN